MKHCRYLLCMLAVTVACATEKPPAGNDALRIDRFEVTKNAAGAKIVGLDANKAIVGWVELKVGTFASDTEGDYLGEVIDGRRLTGQVRGDDIFWEDASYLETMLPFPTADGPMAEFLSDPQVASILHQWKVDFEPRIRTFSLDENGEVEYSNWTNHDNGCSSGAGCCNGGGNNGDFGGCGPTSGCGSHVNGPINTCGGANDAISAAYCNNGYYGSPYDGYLMNVQQCCPGPMKLYVKQCNITNTNRVTGCGTAPAGSSCKGCPSSTLQYSTYCAIQGSPNIPICLDGNCF